LQLERLRAGTPIVSRLKQGETGALKTRRSEKAAGT
jgi:hypothetical protein